MKIPTKHINTKHTFMFAGALAAVVALAPTATFAQGGGDGRDGRSPRSSSHQANAQTSNSTQSSEMNGQHHGHGGNYHNQRWWGNFSAENFQKMHDARLAKLDKTITDNNLTVENGESLRAEVVANADDLKAQLSALEELRMTIDKDTITDEQRAALKAQSITTFESFYDYSESMYNFKLAIKNAADMNNKNVDVDPENDNQ
jgi:hypothetical protein